MDALAAAQPGYRGIDSARGADGLGITVSYWADEAARWRGATIAEHAAIRERGRGALVRSIRSTSPRSTRSYDWREHDAR